MSVCYQFAESGTCRFGDRCRFDHVADRQADASRNDKRRRRSSRGAVSSPNYIADFFATYPEYPYDPNASFMTQFYNMCDYFGRQRESKAEEKATARKQLQDAMVLQFNGMYGTAVNDPKAWQSLCRALEIEPVPDTLKDCREAVMQTHVNICDLVAAPTLGKPRIFPTEGELAIYTRKTGKIFPRNNVHAGTLLRYLLRRIFDPPSP